MKKILSLAIVGVSILLMNSEKLIAQDTKLVNVGLKGGLNYSWLGLEDTKDETGLIGYHAGIVVRVNVAKSFALQGEALYSVKGSKVTYDNALFEGNTSLRLNYIDLPLLLVLKLNENINIQGGAYASLLLNASAKNNSSVDLFDFENEVNNSNFKNTDFGLTAGLGVEVQHLLGGIRYSQGVQKIEEEKSYNGTTYSFSDAKNSMIQVYMGFVF
jgi:hypothetical protein